MRKLLTILLISFLAINGIAQMNLSESIDLSVTADTFINYATGDRQQDLLVQFQFQNLNSGTGNLSILRSSYPDSNLISAYDTINITIFPYEFDSLKLGQSFEIPDFVGRRLGIDIDRGTLTQGTVNIKTISNRR